MADDDPHEDRRVAALRARLEELQEAVEKAAQALDRAWDVGPESHPDPQRALDDAMTEIGVARQWLESVREVQ